MRDFFRKIAQRCDDDIVFGMFIYSEIYSLIFLVCYLVLYALGVVS